MNAKAQNSLQILVVDDEPMVRKTMLLLLQRAGHAVQCVEGGTAALSLLAARPFDLVITDYFMLEMNGVKLVTSIKQSHPDLPVIMMTAFAADFIVRGKPHGGADWILEKPFSWPALEAAIITVTSLKITTNL